MAGLVNIDIENAIATGADQQLSAKSGWLL